ncbi:hypothetical protein [Micromonospora sp. NPDC002717]
MTDVRIEPWSEGDLDLLRRLNAPEIRASSRPGTSCVPTTGAST